MEEGGRMVRGDGKWWGMVSCWRVSKVIKSSLRASVNSFQLWRDCTCWGILRFVRAPILPQTECVTTTPTVTNSSDYKTLFAANLKYSLKKRKWKQTFHLQTKENRTRQIIFSRSSWENEVLFIFSFIFIIHDKKQKTFLSETERMLWRFKKCYCTYWTQLSSISTRVLILQILQIFLNLWTFLHILMINVYLANLHVSHTVRRKSVTK